MPLDLINQKPLKTLPQPPENSWIKLSHFQIMVSFIALATWYLQPMLTPASTMNPRDAAEQAPISFDQITNLNPGGMDLYSQLHK